ncbi:HhH-GPD family base excision DNA repair protein [Aspergillus luchuensis]|uniref:HhH-GPD family base excision DNA repair protein n=1 Tax=Aspergillus kawachii TaxID=1069201 RepID=A0A146F6R1_ASPKA|nr:HhH-GPD family base excision DNA repair protein [Aspergillus luchuensis]
MGKSGFTAQIGMERLKRNYGTGPVESAAARRGPIKDPRPGMELEEQWKMIEGK